MKWFRHQRAAAGLLLCVALLAAIPPTVASARDKVTLGVLAYRPEPVMQKQYQPLAEYLSSASGIEVAISSLNQDDLTRALAANRIDFFLTNPSHFLLIRSERSLTGVLATQLRGWEGQSTGSIGGVILARAERDDIRGLQDLKGKSIASPGLHYLGGYQAQALELQEAGLNIRRDNRIVFLGNHDRVLRSVIAGDTDIGFIRTGVLEELLVADPALENEVKIVNQQALRGYPFRVSTRLYPEWPLVSLPHVDPRTIRRIASALFALEPEHAAAQAAGLSGFSPAADYQSVEYLARSLRLPPYDQVPRITWVDMLKQYRMWMAAVTVLFLLLVVTSIWLGRKKRQLALESRRLRELVASSPQPMLMIHGRELTDCNRAAVELLRCDSGTALIGKQLAAFSPQRQPDGELSAEKLTNLLQRVQLGDVVQTEWLFVRLDKTVFWVDMTLAPVYEHKQELPGILCSWYDITRRKEAEKRQRLALKVFENAREAIFITDAHGVVIDTNAAYFLITGWDRNTAVGSLPPLPVDEGSSILVAARKHGVWNGEYASRNQDGRRLILSLSLSSVFDDSGDLSHFVGVFSDITRLKDTEKKLRTMAHYDALTGLPNRVLFADRLQQGMAQARRQGYQLGVIYIDLDQFKPVNDAYGHDAGDQLLIEVARRLRMVLREEDTLARLGGDEFAAIVVNVEDDTAIETLLQRLLEAVVEPAWVADHTVEVSASIGYTLYPQPAELDGDQLLRQADQAMYRAKKQGRNGYCKFSDSTS